MYFSSMRSVAKRDVSNSLGGVYCVVSNKKISSNVNISYTFNRKWEVMGRTPFGL